MKKYSVLFLILVLCFAGCSEEPDADISIGTVTVFNIPASFTVDKSSTAIPLTTFKVYLNASNYMDANKDPASKGMATVSEGTLANGTYTVTMQLEQPNHLFDPNDKNPNLVTGPWSGTSIYFSIMISPQDTSAHGVDAIWAKGGYDLNKGKASINWNDLIDFRDGPAILQLGAKALALYNDIVCNDPEITTGP
ncbi:MAG: hypothetical protein FWD36_00610 [Treponema sp.]|nr:hypothetical protein [Treponema sp.]